MRHRAPSLTLNDLSWLCLLERFRIRSLKAITKKSCLINLSIRAWSHRQVCAVSAEAKGWCWVLSVCLVPGQWSSITEQAKAERGGKKSNLRYSQICAASVLSPAEEGEVGMPSLSCSGWETVTPLDVSEEFQVLPVWQNKQVTQTRPCWRWIQNNVRPEVRAQYLAVSWPTLHTRQLFCCSRRSQPVLGCSSKVYPAAFQQLGAALPPIPDPVLVPHVLAWERETNINDIWENNFSLLLVCSLLFCLHVLCLSSQQVYVGAFAEAANAQASYRLRTCRNYSMHKE